MSDMMNMAISDDGTYLILKRQRNGTDLCRLFITAMKSSNNRKQISTK